MPQGPERQLQVVGGDVPVLAFPPHGAVRASLRGGTAGAWMQVVDCASPLATFGGNLQALCAWTRPPKSSPNPRAAVKAVGSVGVCSDVYAGAVSGGNDPKRRNTMSSRTCTRSILLDPPQFRP